MKRTADIFFSLFIIILFLPLGILITLILKFTGEGEVFYIQMRIGKNGDAFGLIKFVTMVKNSPKIGAGDITLKEDSRVLPVGKFLRKTKLNEFPQFINVLYGDMSIVGPRPLVERQFDMIPNELKVKIKNLNPGITGIGSIIFRDEESFLSKAKNNSQKFYENEIVPFKAMLENWYHDNLSFYLDMIIILLTIIEVFLPGKRFYKFFLRNLPNHPIFNSN